MKPAVGGQQRRSRNAKKRYYILLLLSLRPEPLFEPDHDTVWTYNRHSHRRGGHTALIPKFCGVRDSPVVHVV